MWHFELVYYVRKFSLPSKQPRNMKNLIPRCELRYELLLPSRFLVTVGLILTSSHHSAMPIGLPYRTDWSDESCRPDTVSRWPGMRQGATRSICEIRSHLDYVTDLADTNHGGAGLTLKWTGHAPICKAAAPHIPMTFGGIRRRRSSACNAFFSPNWTENECLIIIRWDKEGFELLMMA